MTFLQCCSRFLPYNIVISHKHTYIPHSFGACPPPVSTHSLYCHSWLSLMSLRYTQIPLFCFTKGTHIVRSRCYAAAAAAAAVVVAVWLCVLLPWTSSSQVPHPGLPGSNTGVVAIWGMSAKRVARRTGRLHGYYSSIHGFSASVPPLFFSLGLNYYTLTIFCYIPGLDSALWNRSFHN